MTEYTEERCKSAEKLHEMILSEFRISDVPVDIVDFAAKHEAKYTTPDPDKELRSKWLGVMVWWHNNSQSDGRDSTLFDKLIEVGAIATEAHDNAVRMEVLDEAKEIVRGQPRYVHELIELQSKYREAK